MKRSGKSAALMIAGLLAAFASDLPAQRQMENLGRGVVAVRKSSTEAFISWRLLALDSSAISFNLYRSANGGAAVKLNASPLTAGTNYTDNTANFTATNTYHVRPVISGVEQAASTAFTLPANVVTEPVFRIPLQTPADRTVHNVWVGDIDGDGEYEYFACWTPTTTGLTQLLQAYKRDGTLLWQVDFGPNSVDSDNIYVTSATVVAGQWDGITVYDLDGDGRTEVIVKSANGVKFGDNTTLTHGDNITQFISVLDGVTGAERARTVLPNPWKTIENRPLGTLFGIGYPDGVRPSLMIHAKSRESDDGFHQINSSWDFRNGSLTQRWSTQWSASDPSAPPTNHQMRILDLDGDGKDEMMPGMYALNNNGSLRYNLDTQGIVHGDRFHVGDLDPNRPGLEHYGIQQYNPDNLIEFMADASTGQPIWMHTIAASEDSARGTASDIDPAHPGCEVWSFYGIRTATGTEISPEPNRPYPNLQIWWDGDLLGENLDKEQVDKWNPATGWTTRLLTGYHYNATSNGRSVPMFYGDIAGDWREEYILASYDMTQLVVYTTTYSTATRLYTLAQNPAYRNCLTVKGYVQENLPDYFLGAGMATPPTPDITYVQGTPISLPPTFVSAGTVAAGTGTITPGLPAGLKTGDILLLFVETANQAVSISNQNGGTWAAVTGAQQGTGAAGGTDGVLINAFWSRYNGTQGAPTASDSGNHQLARMIAIRGAAATGNPWNAVAGGVDTTADTSAAIPGATTTAPYTLVVTASAGAGPDSTGTANLSAWTNATLVGLTERTDNTSNAGNGGSLGIATGIATAAGNYGTTAATHASSAKKAMVSIAIR